MISRKLKNLKQGGTLHVETKQERQAAYQWAWRYGVKITTRAVLGGTGFDILKEGKKKG